MIRGLFLPVLAVCLPFGAAVAGAQMLGQPGCGAENERIAVTTTADKPALKAALGKAVLVVFQNDNRYNANPRPTNLIGIDGQWVGATHGHSYIILEADPGLRHICTYWQGTSGEGLVGAALRLQMDSGGIYYLEIADRFDGLGPAPVGNRRPATTLQLLDPDQGELMRRSYELAVAKLNK